MLSFCAAPIRTCVKFSWLLFLRNLVVYAEQAEQSIMCEHLENADGQFNYCASSAASSTALALVPYDDLKISEFNRQERFFDFGNGQIAVSQNWRELGVAAVVWDAAVVLCEHLNRHNDLVKHKRCIELGAGTGLVGITAGRLGADITITDRAVALENVRNNVARNSLSTVAVVTELTWGRDTHKFTRPFDVILGADVIYIEETFHDLLQTLVDLSDEKTLIIIACRIRYDRDNRFLDMLRRVFTVDVEFYDSPRDVQVLHVRKLKPAIR